jgi:hypothetical protein
MSDFIKYPIPNKLYQHYKGGVYEFLFMAPHTETGEKMVIYKSILYGSYHARPLDSWNSKTTDGLDRFVIYNHVTS